MTTPINPENILPLVDMLSATYRRFLSLGHSEAEALTLTRYVFETVATRVDAHLKAERHETP